MIRRSTGYVTQSINRSMAIAHVVNDFGVWDSPGASIISAQWHEPELEYYRNGYGFFALGSNQSVAVEAPLRQVPAIVVNMFAQQGAKLLLSALDECLYRLSIELAADMTIRVARPLGTLRQDVIRLLECHFRDRDAYLFDLPTSRPNRQYAACCKKSPAHCPAERPKRPVIGTYIPKRVSRV